MSRLKPQWVAVKIEKLRPTQLTVGRIEVALKRKEWAEMSRKGRAEALANHWFPGVCGPDGKHYITDHHHFGLALLEEGVRKASLLVLKDLSWLSPQEFWTVMEINHWVHPYDSRGVRRRYADIPKHLTKMRDDPYRSLAGQVRRAGGYAKDTEPFTEFLWADFFRGRVAAVVIRQHFARAVDIAAKLARGEAARYLPGWTGVSTGS
jgi:hypothetical protein